MKLNSNTHNFEYLKRLAKNIKREQKVSHLKALTLTVQNLGFRNWKHFLNESKAKRIISASSTNNTLKKTIKLKEHDPYRKLLVGAVNKLLIENRITLNSMDVDEENERGYIFCKLFGNNSIVIWRNIGYGELHISLWWKYNHEKHPQANLDGNRKERFISAEPLAKRYHYPKFVGVVANCWLERRNGKYIQGVNREGILISYTRKGELKHLKELPILKPKGYEISGNFHI